MNRRNFLKTVFGAAVAGPLVARAKPEPELYEQRITEIQKRERYIPCAYHGCLLCHKKINFWRDAQHIFGECKCSGWQIINRGIFEKAIPIWRSPYATQALKTWEPT